VLGVTVLGVTVLGVTGVMHLDRSSST